ncbi:hypothetical protein [Microcystis phage Mel-JY01]
MSFQFGNNVSLMWKKLRTSDYTISPFTVNKKFEFSSRNDDSNRFNLKNIQVFRALYAEGNRYPGNVTPINSELYTRPFLTQSLVDPKLLWYYLDHNYYNDFDYTEYPINNTEYDRDLFLWQTASVMCFPREIFGEGIKRNSVDITSKYFQLGFSSEILSFRMIDDGNGNIIDTYYDELRYIDKKNLVLYLGFNEKYREYNRRNKLSNYVIDSSPNEQYVEVLNPKNINYSPGIFVYYSGSQTLVTSGVCSEFSGSSLYVHDKNLYNFNYNKDYSFSFWIRTNLTQSYSTELSVPLFNKSNTIDADQEYTIRDGRPTINRFSERKTNVFPFEIDLMVSGSESPMSIHFKRSSAFTSESIISTPLTQSQWHHVVCQKSGSEVQIWLDGELNVSSSAIIKENTINENNFFIASNGMTNKFAGSLDEIRIYNKSLNYQQIKDLSDNDFYTGYAYQKSTIGNVFYSNGTIVISDPRPKYRNIFVGSGGNGFNYGTDGVQFGFSGSIKNTVTQYQHEIVCRIRKSEFNFTMNPSVYRDKDPYSNMVDDYVTSSLFNPYITTIGLYNDERELLAVGKLASPLEKRDDVDMNIIIRYDM